MKSNINYGSVAASYGIHTRQFSRDLLFENWFFKDSPYWTFWVHDVDGLEVKTHCSKFGIVTLPNLRSSMIMLNWLLHKFLHLCLARWDTVRYLQREKTLITTTSLTWQHLTRMALMSQVNNLLSVTFSDIFKEQPFLEAPRLLVYCIVWYTSPPWYVNIRLFGWRFCRS